MSESVFTKHWDNTGFTLVEAERKKTVVDEAHKVGTSKSHWNPSTIVPDDRGGYKVVITTKC